MKILSVGLTMCDFLAKPVDLEDFQATDTAYLQSFGIAVGGDAFNVAANLAALGTDMRFVSAVGKDEVGELVLSKMRSLNVPTDYVKRSEKYPSGCSMIAIRSDGERSIFVRRGASQYLTAEDVTDEMMEGCDLLFIGSACGIPGLENGGFERLLSRARKNGLLTAMDVTGKIRPESVEALIPAFPLLDYFLPSILEARGLSGQEDIGEAAEWFRRAGVKTVVIKNGGKGAYWSSEQGSGSVPAFKGPVIDTTGAGDAFVSGFLAALARGYSIPECVSFGNASGLVRCGIYGASGSMVSFEQLEERIRSESR